MAYIPNKNLVVTSYIAITSGIGYVIGDTLDLVQLFSDDLNTVLAKKWINTKTGLLLSSLPLFSDLEQSINTSGSGNSFNYDTGTGQADLNTIRVALADESLSIQNSKLTDIEAKDFSTASNQVLQTTALNNILSELTNSIAFSETIWYDLYLPTVFYVRSSTVDQTTGIINVTWKNPDGTPANTTGLTLVQANASPDYEITSFQYKAVSAGFGYSINDILVENKVMNLTAGVLLNTIWDNKTTNTIIPIPDFSDLAVDSSLANESTLQLVNNNLIDSLLELENLVTNTLNIPNVIGDLDSIIPSKLIQIGGSDGTNAKAIKTNSSGQLDIRNLTSSDQITVIPSGIQTVSGTLIANLGTIGGVSTEVTLSALNNKIPSSLTTISSRLLVDGSGVIQPVSVSGTVATTLTGTPSVSVSNFPSSQAVTGTFFQATQPISATVLPLPTGAATETTLSALNNKIPVLGQALAAASTPVVLTAIQQAALTPPAAITGFNLETTQSAINTKIPSNLTVTATRLLVDNSGVTQPISATSLPLPTNASTSSLQTTGNTSLSNIDTKTPSLGQALAASSTPVVLPALQITALTPPSNTGYALDSSLSTLNTSINSLLKPASTLASVTNVGSVTSITNSLPSGSNVIGKFGIDQTTPGTTNKVNIGTDGTVSINSALPTGANTIGAISNTSFIANAGTNLNTSLLALDSTLTNGTQKSIVRGGAKGSTTAADVTSTASGANHQTLDVAIYDASGNQITSFGGGTQYTSGTSTVATPIGTMPIFDNAGTISKVSNTVGLPVNIVGGSSSGTQYADGVTRGTATGTLLMVDDGTNIQSALGTAAGVLKIDLSATTANATAVKVDGSAVTQPISGTITANAGTNLNTSLLALESGGNLATVKTNTDNLALAQASATSGQKGNLIFGAVTAGVPTYTTAQSNPLSLTTSGALRTDSSATTQPISGTVTANISGPISNTSFGVSNGSGASAVNIQDGGNSITVDGSVSIIGSVDTELPAAAALADGISNPTTPTIGAVLLAYNGTTYDRVRTNGTDNDADPSVTTGILSVESHQQSYNGTSWDRDRTVSIGNNVVPLGIKAAGVYGQYNATAPTITDTRYTALQTDINGNLLVAQINLATYSAAAKAVTPIASATQPTFSIQGSASKKVYIKKIVISVSCTTGTALPTTVSLQRYSSITGGTPVAITAGVYDTTNAAATAVVQNWTAAPTITASGGVIATHRLNWTTAGAAVANTPLYRAEFTFGTYAEVQDLVLRGTSQWIGLLLTAVGTTPVMDCYIEWIERS